MRCKCFNAFLLVLLSVALIFTGCASSDRYGYDNKPSSNEKTESTYSEQGNGSNLHVSIGDPNRKLIYSVKYEIETLKFDDSISQLRQLSENLGGYIESSSLSSEQTYIGYDPIKKADFVLRIPSDKLNDFFLLVGSIGNILAESLESQDVTLLHADREARINSLVASERRLLELLSNATILEHVLDIEQKLAEIRYEIETNISQQNKLDSLIAYSKVTLNVREVFDLTKTKTTPLTFGEKMADTFNKSVSRVWQGMQSFAIWFLGNIIEIAIYIGVIVLIIWLILKLSRRASKRANERRPAYDYYTQPPNQPVAPPSQASKQVEKDASPSKNMHSDND